MKNSWCNLQWSKGSIGSLWCSGSTKLFHCTQSIKRRRNSLCIQAQDNHSKGHRLDLESTEHFNCIENKRTGRCSWGIAGVYILGTNFHSESNQEFSYSTNIILLTSWLEGLDLISQGRKSYWNHRHNSGWSYRNQRNLVSNTRCKDWHLSQRSSL